MKRIYFLVITFLISVNFAQAQDNWVTHKGDDRVSIKFPSEPAEVIPGTYSVLGTDSVAYIFTIVDFEKVANLDSATLAPLIATPAFADQLKTGIKQSLPDVDFADFTIGSWKGFTSYSSSGLDSHNKKYVMFLFIIGSKLYSASTVSPPGADAKDNDKFVSSIMLNN